MQWRRSRALLKDGGFFLVYAEQSARLEEAIRQWLPLQASKMCQFPLELVMSQ